jgi:hypothetical protein
MDHPRYFCISPALRRSAYYVLFSAIPLAIILFWVSRFARGEGIVSAACKSGSLLFIFSALTFLPLRWALRIDNEGIARRLFFRWDMWSWSDLASGHIEKRHGYTLVDPQRPFWRRSLEIGCMAKEDIRLVMELINTHYRLSPAPELPDELEMKYGTFFRRSAQFDRNGIHLSESKQPVDFLWSDVRRLHITRMDPLRRDFQRLELVLPDREIELKFMKHGSSPNWKGVTSELLSTFFEQYVLPERIDRDIFGERPSRRIDAERELSEAVKNYRNFCRCNLLTMPFLIGTLIWMAVFKSVMLAVVMSLLSFVYIMPIYYMIYRESHSRRLNLEQQLASFDRPE